MSRGILKSALSTTIRLNLTYRERGSVNEAFEQERENMFAAELQSIPAQNRDTLYRMRWMFVGDVQ